MVPARTAQNKRRVASYIGAGIVPPQGGGVPLLTLATTPTPAGVVPKPADFLFSTALPVITRAAGGWATTHDFDPASVKQAITHTLYVGAGGDDTKDGTTWANRVRSVQRALDLRASTTYPLASTVVQIRIQTGIYRNTDIVNTIPASANGRTTQRDTIIEPCDSSGNVIATSLLSIVIAGIAYSYASVGSQVVLTHEETLTGWTASGVTGVYYAPYTTEDPTLGAWDEGNLNLFGRPKSLRPLHASMATDSTSPYFNDPAGAVRAIAQETGSGALYKDTAAKRYYVHLPDGRAPDANLHISKGSSNGGGARNFYFSPNNAARTTKLWMRNVDFWGGNSSIITLGTPSTGALADVTLVDCISVSTSQRINHCGIMRNVRCGSLCSSGDSFTYFQAAFTEGVYLDVLELDCFSREAGSFATFDLSSNGSSIHRLCRIVRVNCVYDDVQNRAVHDIQDASAWNLGLNIGRIRSAGAAGGAVASGYLVTAGSPQTTKMWLDGIRFNEAPTFALEAYGNATDGGEGGKLFYKGVPVGLPVDVSGGQVIAGY